MPTTICFIRGINVGGRNKVKMADLRELLGSLGLCQARTVLRSGNAVFQSDSSDLTALAAKIEAGIQRAFGFPAHVMLRDAEEFRSILERQPFTAAQLELGSKAAVVFLDAAPTEAALACLIDHNPGRELIHANGHKLYVFFTDGMARSKLTNARIERHLGCKATVRNWNTCMRVMKALDEFN